MVAIRPACPIGTALLVVLATCQVPQRVEPPRRSCPTLLPSDLVMPTTTYGGKHGYMVEMGDRAIAFTKLAQARPCLSGPDRARVETAMRAAWRSTCDPPDVTDEVARGDVTMFDSIDLTDVAWISCNRVVMLSDDRFAFHGGRWQRW